MVSSLKIQIILDWIWNNIIYPVIYTLNKVHFKQSAKMKWYLYSGSELKKKRSHGEVYISHSSKF